jgi:hypothetical protein
MDTGGSCRGWLQPGLQAFGLALYFVVTLWQIWTDAYLARYFNQGEAPWSQ